jgi:proton-dependent oligopeptide transporter, POT family
MAANPDTLTASDRTFFGHPRGLATLFFTEMWERFSYYGMRALLILFMTAPADKGGLGFDVARAGIIYGLYTAMVYLLGLPGGWVADRMIGARRAVLYGGILISAGQFCLVAPGLGIFYTGLALIVLGTGLLKPNVSTIVGMIYAPGDNRRDAGFSIFYMGINLGAFLSPLICGWVGQKINWHLGFGLAGVGMILGLIQYVLGSRYLGDAGLAPAKREKMGKSITLTVAVLILLIAGIVVAARSGLNITPELISDAFGIGLLAITGAIFAWLLLGRGWSTVERKRSLAILVLFVASALFWSAFEQAGSSLNLFAQRSTDKTLLGFQFPASWFQALNSLFIIALAPVFAWVWIALGKREPSSPAKFSIGLLFVGLGFAVLIPAASIAGTAGKVGVWWLTIAYLFQTIGELSLSPVGLSAMTKLAPERVTSMMMGVWFLSLSVGNYLGGRMAALYESVSVPALFSLVAVFSIGAAIVLALLIKPTVRLMSGVK